MAQTSVGDRCIRNARLTDVLLKGRYGISAKRSPARSVNDNLHLGFSRKSTDPHIYQRFVDRTLRWL